MKTIKLPESDYSGMRQFYREELERTLKKLEHIKSVLAQLGDKTVLDSSFDPSLYRESIGETEKNAPTYQKRKYRRKAGRKPMWGPIILKRMKQLNRPLTYNELTDEIMAFANLPPEKRKFMKRAVTNVIFRLRTRDKKLDTFAYNGRVKYIGLKAWFDEDGNIKKVYSRMLPPATLKARLQEAANRKAALIAQGMSPEEAAEAVKPKRGRPAKPISWVWADPSKRPVKKKRKPIINPDGSIQKPERGRPKKGEKLITSEELKKTKEELREKLGLPAPKVGRPPKNK